MNNLDNSGIFDLICSDKSTVELTLTKNELVAVYNALSNAILTLQGTCFMVQSDEVTSASDLEIYFYENIRKKIDLACCRSAD